uniref:Tyrosine-protein phosphatase domain-containing protein n=1 Tax=Caenorhabditis japonica TaxID=281687 RepID=A0A8R1EMG9_CAEJA
MGQLSDTSPTKKRCETLTETTDAGTSSEANGYYKFKVFGYLLILLAIGVFISFHSWFSKSENEPSKNLNTLNTSEEKTASLARMMNAIALQNEFNDGSVTMKEVMAEALDVRNSTLLDSIDEKDSRVAGKAVKTVDLITARPAQTINKTTEKLKKVLFLGDSTSHSSSISQMFSSLNDFNIDLDTISVTVGTLVQSLNNLSQEINSSNPKFDTAVEHFSTFESLVGSIHGAYLTNLKKSMQNFKTLEDLRSFVVDFEQYQLVTNETFLNNLKASLNSLLSSISTIKSWLDAKNKHHAIKMLDDINTILAPSVFGYDKNLLIGFPNGSKDLATLFENLQENWIKDVLNGGKSVSELVRVFGPMTKFESQLSSLEQIWMKSDRENYANTTRKSLISLRIINKANPVDVSDSLSKVNDTFVNLGSIADVNSTVLDEFNQLLDSSEPFTSFTTQLAGFLDAPEVAQFSLTELDIFKVDYGKLKKDEDKFDMLKNKLNISKYSQNLEFFQNQLELLVSAKNATTGYFKTIVEFNSTITDTNVDNIRSLIEILQNVKSEITAVENLVELLNSLCLFSEKERKVIDGISNFLVSVKSKMNESKLLEESLQLEMKETGFLHRFSGFPSARNLTSQLAYTERTLHFFQRKDLKQDFQNLATNGEKLVEFIESLPANEKQQQFLTKAYLEWKEKMRNEAAVERRRKQREEEHEEFLIEKEKIVARTKKYREEMARTQPEIDRRRAINKAIADAWFAEMAIKEAAYEEAKAKRTPLEMATCYVDESYEMDVPTEKRIVALGYEQAEPIDNYIQSHFQDKFEHKYRTQPPEYTHDWCRVRMTKDFWDDCDFYDAAWMYPYEFVFHKIMDKYKNKLIVASAPAFVYPCGILWHWIYETNVKFFIHLNEDWESNFHYSIQFYPDKAGEVGWYNRNKYRHYKVKCLSVVDVYDEYGQEYVLEITLFHCLQRMPTKRMLMLRMFDWEKRNAPMYWENYVLIAERLKQASEKFPAVVMSLLGSGRAGTLIIALQAAVIAPLDDDVGIHNSVHGGRASKRCCLTDANQVYFWRFVHYELLFNWFPPLRKYRVKMEFRSNMYASFVIEQRREFLDNRWPRWLFRRLWNCEKDIFEHSHYFNEWHHWWNVERKLVRRRRFVLPDLHPCIEPNPANESFPMNRRVKPIRRKRLRIGDPPRDPNRPKR